MVIDTLYILLAPNSSTTIQNTNVNMYSVSKGFSYFFADWRMVLSVKSPCNKSTCP